MPSASSSTRTWDARTATHTRLLNYANAEDVSQDTFLRAFERLNQLRELDHFESWLMRIAPSRTSERSRRGGREEPVEAPRDANTPEPGKTGQEHFERFDDVQVYGSKTARRQRWATLSCRR